MQTFALPPCKSFSCLQELRVYRHVAMCITALQGGLDALGAGTCNSHAAVLRL
jgi:hypothetical protein